MAGGISGGAAEALKAGKIDALVVIESTTVRAMISLAGLGIALGAVWWFVLRPLQRRLSLTITSTLWTRAPWGGAGRPSTEIFVLSISKSIPSSSQ